MKVQAMSKAMIATFEFIFLFDVFLGSRLILFYKYPDIRASRHPLILM
jgi:hypothetical protein